MTRMDPSPGWPNVSVKMPWCAIPKQADSSFDLDSDHPIIWPFGLPNVASLLVDMQFSGVTGLLEYSYREAG